MADLADGPVIALEPEGIEIPPGIVSLERFRAWTKSDAFPERGRIDWLQGRLEVDTAAEDLSTHGTPKSAIAGELIQLLQVTQKGFVFIDSTRFASPDADLSVEPDVLVLLVETLQTGRARLIPKASGPAGRFVEIEGTVDLVVECISDSSVAKDKKRLKAAYHGARVREYWLADVRREAVDLEVLLHRSAGYEAAPRDADGFFASAVLGRKVRLRRLNRTAGLDFYSLDVR